MIRGAMLILVVFPGALQDFGDRDTDFAITVSELENTPFGFAADLETGATYPCAGYRIRSSVTRQADTLTLWIGGFVRPSPCYPLAGSATGTVYLGTLREGSRIFRIRYRNEEDLYEIWNIHGEVGMTPLQAWFTTITIE
jgi:hypothetical protein